MNDKNRSSFTLKDDDYQPCNNVPSIPKGKTDIIKSDSKDFQLKDDDCDKVKIEIITKGLKDFNLEQAKKEIQEYIDRKQEQSSNDTTLSRKSTKFKIPSIISCSFGLIICLFVFYFYSETLGILKAFRHSSLFPVIVGGFVLLFAFMLYCCIKIWWEIHQFKVTPEIKINANDEKDHDSHKTEENYSILHDYIKNYPEYRLASDSSSKNEVIPDLFKWDQEKLTSFNELRKKLIQNPYSKKWFDDYEQFQKFLDDAAKSCVTTISGKVASLVVISPYGICDMIIAFRWSFKLVKDLAKIYQLRMNDASLFFITCIIFASVIVIGKADDIGDITEDWLSNFLSEWLPGITAKFFSKFSAKFSEGFFSYHLMNRIGNAARKRLQPMTVKE